MHFPNVTLFSFEKDFFSSVLQNIGKNKKYENSEKTYKFKKKSKRNNELRNSFPWISKNCMV